MKNPKSLCYDNNDMSEKSCSSEPVTYIFSNVVDSLKCDDDDDEWQDQVPARSHADTWHNKRNKMERKDIHETKQIR